MTVGTGRRSAMEAPLNGDLLIEASAGTGKTYALTTLVARLIVEAKRSIDELLVVTFTISAAGELRDRVWKTLHEARRALADPRADASTQARELTENWRGASIRRADATGRLTSALRDFDQANITTIHGFCQRALIEFALPAGIPFRFRVTGDDALGVAAATRDFWRHGMASVEMQLLDYAKSRRFAAEKALPWDESATQWATKQYAKRSEIRGAPEPANRDEELQSRRNRWLAECRSAQVFWGDPRERDAFIDVVRPVTEGHASKHHWKSGKRNDAQATAVVDAFEAGALSDLPPHYAGSFGREALVDRLYKRTPPPATSLFDRLDRLDETGNEYGRHWLADRQRSLLESVRETLHENAWARRHLSFTDLLTELHLVLRGGSGALLAERIRTRYPVALIDEFQDTDRLQADIFEKIYPSDDASTGNLFVVGDPKQSIYRFRGADVFAYLDARKRLAANHKELRLDRNYRSTPKLVRAVNALFGRPCPFVIREFTFETTEAADRERPHLVLHGNDHDSRPFQIEAYRRQDGKKWNKGQLLPAVAEHTADRIARLLGGASASPDGNCTVAEFVSKDGARPVSEGDIAVLVRTGEQGKGVAEALRQRGIESIEMGTDKVFDSDEAASLYRLLYALCLTKSKYDATPLLRGALAADLFGLNLEQLARLRDDDDFWTGWRQRACGPDGWAEVWRKRGIAALIRHILFARESDCASNLLRYPNGPRRLTNYLHLADLLHEAETRHRPSRHGLVDWFRRSRAEPSEADETAQLRLESDESLIKIVTVHRAKGLEFGIVFYPFAWHRRQLKRPEVAEYFDAADQTPVLDLRPSNEACYRQRLEEHADELRLLYVAVTRAKHRCVVGWAQANDAQHAPLAWLLHRNGSSDGQNEVDALNENAARVAKLDSDAWLADVRRFASQAPDAVAVSTFDLAPPEAAASPLRPAGEDDGETFGAQELGRRLASIRQRTSYSALASDAGAARSETEHEQTDRPDHDPDEPDASDEKAATAARRTRQEDEEDELTVFAFPSGSRTGRCLHEIFEKRMQPARDLDSICRDALERHGIEPKWEPVARILVQDAFETPLTRPGEAGNVFRIADLQRPIPELEFHLPVQGLRRTELAACLCEHGYDHSLPDNRSAIDGFLHGFIDLTARHDGRWYVIDYKSNWLGPDLASYSKEAIAESMRHHGYHLQYLLYLTALHRLLALRLSDYDYDRHVGGAFYLFLRGMRPNAPGSGVFHDRPSRACIEAIDACFGEAP